MTDQKQFLAVATIEYFPDAGVASVLVHKPFLIVMDVYIACCMGNEFFWLNLRRSVIKFKLTPSFEC